MFKRQHQHQSQSNPESQSNHQNENDLGPLKTDDEVIAPKKRGRKPGSVAPARQTEALAKIRTLLEMLFSGAAGTCVMLGSATGNVALLNDARIITPVQPDTNQKNMHVQNLIDAILVLAQQDKNVRDMLLAMTTGGAYTNVIIASVPIIVAILANHNLIPPLFTMPAIKSEQVPNGTATG